MGVSLLLAVVLAGGIAPQMGSSVRRADLGKRFSVPAPSAVAASSFCVDPTATFCEDFTVASLHGCKASPLTSQLGAASITLVRASTGTFDESNAVTTCASGQFRIATNGMWNFHTLINNVTNSEALDSWTAAGSGCAAPTVTANNVTAPDGTLTAEKVVFPLCNGATDTTLGQGLMNVQVYNDGLTAYARSDTASAQTCYDASFDDGVDFFYGSVSFSIPQGSSWNRVFTASNSGVNAGNYYLGKLSAGGCPNTIAQTDYIWGVSDAFIGNSSSPAPYIKTTGTAATALTDAVTIPNTVLAVSAGSATFTVVPGWTAATPSATAAVVTSVGVTVGNFDLAYVGGSKLWRFRYGNTAVDSAVQSFSVNTQHTIKIRWRASSLSRCITVDGAAEVCNTTGTAASGAFTGAVSLGPLDGALAKAVTCSSYTANCI